MPILENARHEKFAQNIASGMTQRQAYYDAYPKATNCKPETVDNKASALYRSDEIRARCDELKAASSEKTIMSAVERKKWLTEMILNDEENATNRLKAIDILNKMDGGYTSKLELAGTINNPYEGLTTDELRKLAGE